MASARDGLKRTSQVKAGDVLVLGVVERVPPIANTPKVKSARGLITPLLRFSQAEGAVSLMDHSHLETNLCASLR